MENLKYMGFGDSRVYTISLPPLPAPFAELASADDDEWRPRLEGSNSMDELDNTSDNKIATKRVCELRKYTQMLKFVAF